MIYTVTSTLPSEHGGRTKSLLSRVKMLDKELNIPTKILTTNYNANYKDNYDLFLKQGKVTENIQYENIYDWLSNFKLLTHQTTKFFNKDIYHETPFDITGLSNKTSENGTVVRYYDQGEYVLYRRYYKGTKILKFEDFMSPISKRKIQRWQYNKYGVLHRKIYYSHETEQKIAEEYFDIDGKIYCSKFFNNTKSNNLIYIQIYKDNRPYKTFDTEKALFQYYFESRFTDNDIVFNDARLLDYPLLNISKNTKNILVFHSSHLDSNEIKEPFNFALNNPDDVAKYIVLTHKQKEDIIKVTPIDSNKIDVIPHFITKPKINDAIEKENRFVYIGRLSAEKQLDHLLKAYKLFLDKGFNTQLVIFGSDESNQKKSISNLAHELGIEEQVTINNFTNDPLVEFQKSKASLLTSKYEGFGLSLMESINVGCPVISYDVKYGPSEIINHGENGFLVEPGNITELADYMAEIIENPLLKVKTKSELTYNAAIDNYKKLFKALKK